MSNNTFKYDIELGLDSNIKGYGLFLDLYKNNSEFQNLISKGIKDGMIRFFGDEEYRRINSQNFVSFIPNINEFIDIFTMGYNIGDCVGISKQLSYSYDNVDIVSGILPILKGTLNAEKEGGHCWLETPDEIIDTSLMLVIKKSLKERLGYIEEQRITSNQLSRSAIYQSRKDFINDTSIKITKPK